MKCSYCATPLPDESRFCSLCGANLSDPTVSSRERAAIKELFEALKVAVEGRYHITDMLGRGGMGAVFLAEDLRLERLVAIKVLRPELAEESASVGRFEREARIAARLDHSNIIPVYAVEEVGDLHYFVMKYIRGKSVDELSEDKPLPVDQVRRILLQAARGLGHAHLRNVIHRDVKPSNIMVDEEGHVVITDFGISKALLSKTQYTSTGQMIGTPRYLSPEQAQGIPLDGRSDQYSLAVVGYQLLVGKLPLDAETVHALLYKHIHEVPVAARELRPEIPDYISAAIDRALAKKPDERFPTMEEFANAIGGEQSARPSASVAAAATPPPGLRPRARRVTLILGSLAAAILGVVLVSRSLHAPAQEQTADATQTLAPAAPPAPAPPQAQAPDTTETAVADSSTAQPRAAVGSLAAPPVTVAAADSPAAPPVSVTRRKPPPPKRVPRPRTPTAVAVPESAAGAASVAAPSVGYVTINAVPYGTVSIDGVEVGDTPLVRHELAPGRHIIRIIREGFRPDSSTVVITPGNEVRFSRSLVKESR